MKNLIPVFLLIILLFMSGQTEATVLRQVPAAAKLELNNGSKWKVDQITFNNVLKLKHVAPLLGETVTTLAGYREDGKKWQKGITKMIRECRMKGPGHLALHHWLEPLMQQVAKLNSSATAADAARAFAAVKARLALFDNYFTLS